MRALRVAISLVVCLSFAPLALAQEGDGDERTHAVELGPDEEEARAHFNLAQLQYRRGRFLESAREFEAAYALSPRTELLYNIYIAYRDGGDLEAAAENLRRLLEQDPLPRTLNREHLGARLEALEDQIRQRRELEAAAAAAQQTQEEEEASPPPPPPPEPTGPWVPGFAIAGAGAGLAVVGGVLGGVALSMYADVEARCTDGVCPADTEGDRETGQALTITTDVLLPLGITAAAVGLLLAFVIEEDAPDVALDVRPDGGGVAVRGRF